MTTTSQTDCGKTGPTVATEALCQVSAIGAQNDRFRTSLTNDPEIRGRINITPGIHEHGSDFLKAALRKIKSFEDFSDGNDPYHERDFAAVEVMETKVFWKIDVYDTAYTYGSPDPEDPAQSRRVLTIMLPSEY